jgi:hypothetical protein
MEMHHNIRSMLYPSHAVVLKGQSDAFHASWHILDGMFLTPIENFRFVPNFIVAAV